MSELRANVRVHLDKHGGRSAALASAWAAPQTLDSWKDRGIRKLPDASLLKALARGTDTPDEVALEAALRDSRYLPEEVVGDSRKPAPMTATNDPEPQDNTPDSATDPRAGINHGRASTDRPASSRPGVDMTTPRAARAGLPANGRDTAGEENQDGGHEDGA